MYRAKIDSIRGRFHWQLTYNGRVVARSGNPKGYLDKHSAKQSYESLRRLCGSNGKGLPQLDK